MARADVQLAMQSPLDVTCKIPQGLHVTHCRGLYTTAQLVKREGEVSSMGIAVEEASHNSTVQLVLWWIRRCEIMGPGSRARQFRRFAVFQFRSADLPAKSLCLSGSCGHPVL